MKNLKIILVFVILLFLPLTLAHTGETGYGHHMMSGMTDWYSGMEIFRFITWILIIVVLVLLICWLIKQIDKTGLVKDGKKY